MSGYSVKKASIYAGASLGVAGLVGTFQTFAHHAREHFDTLSDAFIYVAQPEAVVATAAICIVIGAGIEFSNWYHRTLDSEESEKIQPKNPSPP